MVPRRFGRCALLAAALLAVLGVGEARAQVSENIIFHSNLDEHAQYNDIWGYTAPGGEEYALLGTSTGLAVINIVDPDNPYETGFIPGPTSTWRDIKTYQHYAYVVTEGGGGLVIVDLSNPENPLQVNPNYTGFSSAHNLYIDETTARCYIAGANLGSGGVRILSLANPEAPVEVGSWESYYLHDVYVLDNRLYGSAIYAGTLYVMDVTDPGSISVIASKGGYPNAFTHNAWATADNNYVMTTDETSGAHCRLWDVSNLPTITETDSYRPSPTSVIPHNTQIDGDLAFISFYTLGARVVDITDRYNLQEVGFYDTYPATDGATYDGCWGAFPFFGTNPDLFVASDIGTGLYVFEYKGPLGTIAGEVTEAGSPSTKIANATVLILQSGLSTTTDASGLYSLQDVAGDVDVQVSAFGYQTTTVPATIVAGTTTPLDVELTPLPGGSLAGTVTDAATAQPLEGATVELVGTPLADTTGASGTYAHAPIPPGTYTLRCSAFGYNSQEAEVAISVGSDFTVDFALSAAPYVDDFETATFGWVVSGGAIRGQWERGDPEGTVGGTVQPEDDHTSAPGVNAWITGLQAGSSVGSYDVDGGQTILTSPFFDITGLDHPRLSYWRWYVTGFTTNPTTDAWVVEVSSDGGGAWVDIENTEEAAAAWVHVDVALDSLIVPSPIVKFRFTAQDTGAGSITEAGLDDFMVYDTETAAGTDAPWVGTPEDARLSLGPGVPNPFRAGEGTVLQLKLVEDRDVRARVFDVRGRYVATLVDARLKAGAHAVAWNGRPARGGLAPAGVYFVKLQTSAGEERTRKLLLLR